MSEPKENGCKEGVFPRRYLIIAGGYLFTVVLLLSLIVLYWGRTPATDLPGGEPKAEEKLLEKDEALLEEVEPAGSCLEEKSGPEQTVSHNPNDAGQPGGSAGAEGEEEGEKQQQEKNAAAANTAQGLLPRAASPLPQWELYRPFGCYFTEPLPSGGSLHALSKGAYLLATPGAPVAALWDGLVAKADKSSVLLQHEGGYATYYGNLREVWVEEGYYVNRGENIGLMPHVRSEDEIVESMAPPAQVFGSVPLRTVWKGYLDENRQGRQKELPELWEEAKEALAEDKALLYLEVRWGKSFLDPLRFIPPRN